MNNEESNNNNNEKFRRSKTIEEVKINSFSKKRTIN